jgi:hypothetical protein
MSIAWFICDKDVFLSLLANIQNWSLGSVRKLVLLFVHVSTQVVMDSMHNYVNVNLYP